MTAELVEDVTLRMPVGRDWTFEDLLQLPDDGRRYEIFDGSLHVSPAPRPRHQVAASRLVRLLEEAAPEDLVPLPAVDVDCGRSVLQPDVVVAPTRILEGDAVKLAPADVLLAAEVVSPSSTRMDRLVKPSVLAQAGIPAYWRVELDGPGTPLVVVHALVDEAYREVATVRAGEEITVDQPYPVRLRPAELAGPRRRR